MPVLLPAVGCVVAVSERRAEGKREVRRGSVPAQRGSAPGLTVPKNDCERRACGSAQSSREDSGMRVTSSRDDSAC